MGMATRKLLIELFIAVFVLVSGAGVLLWANFLARRAIDVPVVQPGQTDIPAVSVVARNLEIPWEMAFMPDGGIIFTERPGRVRLIDANGSLMTAPILTLTDVAAIGEGGLLGLALHPGFVQNKFIYLYYTYNASAGGIKNHVMRYVWNGQTLAEPQVILDNIPAGSIHDGGRIKFGPDGCLYITTGETGITALSQDLSSLAGKILRINDDGSLPADDPFPGSPVYSYGHRNPEGLAWDNLGRLWATEHGSSAYDELNLIEPGKNYGWPDIRGDQTSAGMVTPVLNSGASTWAPSGMAYLDGNLYFGGLRGQSLFRVSLSTAPPSLTMYFNGSFGRLRDVVVGPDGMLYVLTNNRDGRGVPTAADDQILRMNPAKL